MFSVIVKGYMLYPFEYHRDKSNLDANGVPNYKGMVTFNTARVFSEEPSRGRPTFQGRGNLTIELLSEENEWESITVRGVGLSLEHDDEKVEEVIRWMKNGKPFFLSEKGKKEAVFDSAPFPVKRKDNPAFDSAPFGGRC